MPVTYDTLLSDTQTIQYTAGACNTNLYPDSNTIAIAGPIWLPRIYGKDLTAFEIASSGKIAISLNDIHTLDVQRSNYIDSNNFKNTIVSQSNYSFELLANNTDLQVILDAYSNNINISAASNISVAANNGNLSLKATKDMTLSASNNYSLVAKSNVDITAANGGAQVIANNSNMYLKLASSNNTVELYSSNLMNVSACNTFSLTASSNLDIVSVGGEVYLSADASNMTLHLNKATDNITLYTVSNLIATVGNDTTLTSTSNVSISANTGSFSVYSEASNMSFILDSVTDNVTLYAASNVFISASNNYNLNAKSNINIGALAGDLNSYANGSNMFLTMTAATNNVSLFASNNYAVSVSNNYTVGVNSNISVSTVAGDYRLYINNSNMFLRMSSTTNNVNTFSSNNTVMSASNSFNVYAKSNMTVSTVNGSVAFSANSSNMYVSLDSATNNVTVFASNDIQLSTSNDYYLNAKSNVLVGALAGSAKVYADGSNLALTLDQPTDTATLYAVSNIAISASNNLNINATSNILVGSQSGDVKLAVNNSNMTVTLDHATNNVSVFASNNVIVSASNNFTNYVKSNLTFSTLAGDVTVSANSSNMSLVMDHLTNNISVFASNNLLVSVSNNFATSVNSNYSLNAVAGSVSVAANNSNMYLTLDSTTNNVSLFTSNDTLVSTSNNFSVWAQSNVSMAAVAGSFAVSAQGSNMYLTMDSLTNNTSVFTSNDLLVTASNSLSATTKSNVLVGALAGDVKVYANSSNMFLTLDHVTNNATLYASNNLLLSASNDAFLNTNSNVYVGAKAGSLKLYATSSNMFLTMTTGTNNVALFASNNYSVSASNSFNTWANSNVLISANKGDLGLYANSSNMFVTMDHTTNDLSVYASNNLNITTSNSATLVTYSNVGVSASLGSLSLNASTSNMYLNMSADTLDTTLFTSNNFQASVSNDVFINANSNVLVSALAGDAKLYADSSNLYLSLTRATDEATLYASSNVFISASNTINLNAKSNVLVGALAGSAKVYADNSNMYLTLDKSTDNVSLYAVSNVAFVASNNLSTTAKSNVTVGALSGSYKVYANASNMFMTMDSVTNNTSVYTSNLYTLSASNAVSIGAQSNVSITSVVADIVLNASNNITATASNDFLLTVTSNIGINSVAGTLSAYVNNSNMFVVLDGTTNNISVFSSNNTTVSVSNDLSAFVQSNVSVSANYGSLSMYANQSNMSVVLDNVTNNLSVYASNNVNVTTSNSYTLSTLSNVSLSGNNGSVKVYAQGSNMSLTMDAATRNTTLYTSNNMFVSASNNYNLNANSNILAGALAGSVKVYANGSNMFVTLDKSTDNVTVFASNNILESASNSFTFTANSNVTVNAINGDFSTYVDSSNMYLTMSKATDDITLYTVSNINVTASNSFSVSTKSNVLLGALAGDAKIYSDNSNLYLTLIKSTDTASLYSASNIVFVASNNLSTTAKSNITVGALSGSYKVYSHASNMSIVLDSATDNVSVYASNNLALTACNVFSVNAGTDVTVLAWSNITVSGSNNLSVETNSNVSINAVAGSFTANANNSNMFFTLDSTTNNATLYTSNNFQASVSNDVLINANSNVLVSALAGDAKLYADSSNLYLSLTRATDEATLYASSNVFISASNTMNLNAKSNVLVGALAGSAKVYADNSNMYLTLDSVTDNISLYAVSNVAFVASNNLSTTAKSNVTVGALSGSYKVYANASNMFMTMDSATNNTSVYTSNLYTLSASNAVSIGAQSNVSITAVVNNVTVTASNNVSISASNDFISTAKSNVTINASKGSWSAYANDSNMYLTMDQSTNKSTLYGFDAVNVVSSNTFLLDVQSNIAISSYGGDLTAYANSNMNFTADSSNMYLKFTTPSDTINMYSLSNVALSASNNMFLNAASNISIVASNLDILVHRNINIVASNNIVISGSNGVTLNFATINVQTSNDQSFHAQSNIAFYVDAASNTSNEAVFVVQGDQILVRGDIIVTGNINTSNVFSTTVIQESLKVADKEMTLATVGSNFNPGDGPFDGIANNGAGLRIDGVPTGFDSNIPEAYDKTFMWNYGTNGIASLGTANSSNESYWELKGGSFRMTHQKIVESGGSNIVQDISFAFRCNEQDELEILKIVNSNNSTTYKRVARFGRII